MKTYRLGAVCKHFNIGATIIVEFLSKKGFVIEPNPNAQISEEQYALLVKEYNSEKNE
jgi:translation initiation factor IF-2